ncbi:MAG TPA: glycosyltransferase [Candidatus Paceibacterota bacterium]
MSKRLFIIFHGRFPSERAAALYAAEHAKSLAAHMPTTLLVPRRLGRAALPPGTLPASVRVVYLPTLDLFWIPILSRTAFFFSYGVFSCSVFFHLLVHLKSGDTVDTNEALPALAATLVSGCVVYEVHDFPEHFLWVYAMLFRRVRFVLATNEWKRGELNKKFGVPEQKIIMERNGVDVAQFAPQDRSQARQSLGLPTDAHMAVYTGHLYAWKGVDTLARAAGHLKDIEIYFVGGTLDDIVRFKEQYGAVQTIHIVGQVPHAQVPLWLAAADVLILPNTKNVEISAHYTSPMKLFEYMASGRPIVASLIPSIAEVLSEDAAFFVPPDDPAAMARAISKVLSEPREAESRASRAQSAVLEYSWIRRAQRLIERLA